MKRPILPEFVHVTAVEHHNTRSDISKTALVPYKWLVFNGQEKWDVYTWNKKYTKQINEIFGDLKSSRLYVLEFRAIQNMAYVLKRGRELGFDIIEYAKQFKESDIKFTNSVYY